MFCRLAQRRVCVALFVVLCLSVRTFAADSRAATPQSTFLPAGVDPSPVDVTPIVFDPVLSSAVTPASTARAIDALNNKEATIIPLPPAAWTGLAGLVSLGLIRGRRKLLRFLS